MTLHPGQRRPYPPCARLEVEQLEERCLLDGVSFFAQPVVPVISAATKAHLRDVYIHGLHAGNHFNVFSKVGDSMTANQSAFVPLGNFAYNPANPFFAGAHTDLATAINFFRAQPVDGSGANSFNHTSLAAFPGWATYNVLAGPEQAELAATRPAFVLIMLGTNDLVYDALSAESMATFRDRIKAVANTALAAGVIPVLSTIPDTFFAGGIFEASALIHNQIIAEVAAALDVPLYNYWRAMQGLPNKGVDAGGVHPLADPFGNDFFTKFGLLFGYNMRNFTAAEVLDKLLRVVVEDGAPDSAQWPLLSTQRAQFVTGVYQDLLGHAPDPGGLNFWGNLIESGAISEQELIGIIWLSAEHRAAEVKQYYVALLHRNPSAGEVTGWVELFLAGFSDGQLRTALMSSPEFLASHSQGR